MTKYKDIPENTVRIYLYYDGGYCCEECTDSWVAFKLIAETDQKIEKYGRKQEVMVTLWESDWYDSSLMTKSGMEPEDLQELRDSIKEAFKHYNLNVDDIEYFDDDCTLDWEFNKYE